MTAVLSSPNSTFPLHELFSLPVRRLHAGPSGHRPHGPRRQLGPPRRLPRMHRFPRETLLRGDEHRSFELVHGRSRRGFVLPVQRHIGPSYSVLSRQGYFQSRNSLLQLNSRLQGHPATEEGLPASGQRLLGAGAQRRLWCSPGQEAEWRGPLVYSLPRTANCRRARSGKLHSPRTTKSTT